MILTENAGLLILGIGVIVFLFALFFVSYVLNKKTPIPKGCEQIAYDVQNCSGCSDLACEYHIRAKEILEKIKEEIKEDKE